LEYYFEANGVDDEDKQWAILLSVCGSKTYKLIRNLITPRKQSEKTFAELVELVHATTLTPKTVGDSATIQV
jgi:hypothetical protein